MPNELKSQKVGLKFKLARSKLNLSLEDISKDILINIKYLKAIEEDNYSIFPACLLYTSPSPRDRQKSRMPSSA